MNDEERTEPPSAAAPPFPARARHKKALLEHFERTRNDNGQRLTSSTIQMKTKLCLVVTLDGIYTAPRYDLVVKDKRNPGTFYPSENAGVQNPEKNQHQALLARHITQWQNSMETAEGQGAVASPKHLVQIREQTPPVQPEREHARPRAEREPEHER